MKNPLDVSRGQTLTFATNGVPVSGIIVGSRKEPGQWAVVSVQTTAPVPQEAKLTMPDLPETGGCGLASPTTKNGLVTVELLIGYSYIDEATIGR